MSAGDLAAILGDVLIVLGLLVTTLGILGMFRMPDAYSQLHAASKAVVFGVVALLAATLTTGDASIASRALLIAAFLLLTMPVAAHVVALAAHRRGERMLTPGARDESLDPPPPGAGRGPLRRSGRDGP